MIEAHSLFDVPVSGDDEVADSTTSVLNPVSITDGNEEVENTQEKVNKHVLNMKRKRISARRNHVTPDQYDELCCVCKNDGELLCCDTCTLVGWFYIVFSFDLFLAFNMFFIKCDVE